MKGLVGDLRTFAVGRDPYVRPKTFRGRAFATLTVLAGIGIGAGCFAYLDDHSSHGSYIDTLVATATGVAFVALFRAPLLAWRISFVQALITPHVMTIDDNLPFAWHPFIGWLFPPILFAVAVRHTRGVSVLVWLCTAALGARYVDDDARPAALILITAAMLLGDLIGSSRRAKRQLAAEAERTELEQAKRAVLEERTRIARELHDVVAHHMSLIAVRAETAPYRMNGLGPPVTAEFIGIAEQSREALTEMRRLLGVLRSPDTGELATAPQPGVGDLAELVDAARASGVDAVLTVDMAAEPPSAVALSAYRIAQEALTNARRHAAGAQVRIDVRTTTTELTLDVANGAGTVALPSRAGARLGLVGMRERAAMLGGHVQAAPTSDGGFRVRAELPLGDPQ